MEKDNHTIQIKKTKTSNFIGKSLSSRMRALLNEELAERTQRRNNYSLRAFARFLDIDPSALSKIMSGKRRLSTNYFTQFLERLNLPQEKIMDLHEKDSNESTSLESKFKNLSLEVFSIISDWEYFALLELTKLKGFKANINWIASILSISPTRVKTLTDKLIENNLLSIDENGTWTDVSEYLTTMGNTYTAMAFRNLQKQILQKAIEALEDFPMDERDQTSLTIAVNEKDLPQVKEYLTKSRRELSALLSASDEKDRVYHLSLSFYPVTLKLNKKRSKPNGSI